MCRLAAYIGKSIRLQSLLLEPQYSLFTQSWQPRELAYAKLNADGFGFGWYDDGDRPAIYRNCAPIWSDANLETLARVLRAPLWLAMVRSATSDYGFSPTNIQPFQYKNYLFVHNGFIKDFNQASLKKILTFLDPEISKNIRGATDSEYLFGLFCHFAEETAKEMKETDAVIVKTALLKTIEWISANLPGTKTMLNIIVGNGEMLIATRTATYEMPPSLYICYGDGMHFPENSQLIASERFSDDDGWQSVPADTLIIAEPNKEFAFESI